MNEIISNKELAAAGANVTIQLVTFNIGSGEYAVDIGKVQEINRYVEVTKIPNTPDFVEGVINLRGRVMPVINLAKVFGHEPSLIKETKIMIAEIRGNITGLIVDNVSEVLRISSSVIEPPPALSNGNSGNLVRAIAKLEDRLLMLLDLDMLLLGDTTCEAITLEHN
jgi:purine-binding chemotaxis protein CheW